MGKLKKNDAPLVVGKEYIFLFSRQERKRRGIFTGYDSSGNAVIRTKKKGEWSIPPSELFITED